jgi:hypothetical protein
VPSDEPDVLPLRARLYAVAMSVACVGAVLSALLLPPDERGFPLSRYPMFATGRPKRERLPFVEVDRADGSTVRIGVHAWTDGGGSVGRNELQRAANAAPAEQRALCGRLAVRVAASDDPAADGARQLRIVEGGFDRRAALRDGAAPFHRRTVASCPISRAGEAP